MAEFRRNVYTIHVDSVYMKRVRCSPITRLESAVSAKRKKSDPVMGEVVQFPRERMPVGAAMSAALIRNLEAARKPEPPPYSERDLATADGEINEHVIIALAWHHAQRDQEAIKARGGYEPISDIYRSQLRSFTSLARSMAAVRKARKEAEALPLREKLIRSLELELYRAERGLATGPVDVENVNRLRRTIAAARTVDDAERFPLAQE